MKNIVAMDRTLHAQMTRETDPHKRDAILKRALNPHNQTIDKEKRGSSE